MAGNRSSWPPARGPHSTAVSVDDIRAMAAGVLRHRMVLNYAAESAGETTATVVSRLIETLPLHEGSVGEKAVVEKMLR